MHLIVFGASGQFGRRIVQEGLACGHVVTAFVRDPEHTRPTHERLHITVGDARRRDDVATAIAGQDAVISALGPGGPGISDQHLDILTDGVPNLIAGMQAAGVSRIVAMGSIATLEVAPGLLLRDTPDFPAFARNISGAHLHAAQALAASPLAWTMVCPPLTIEAGERTGVYRVQQDMLIPGQGRISYEDAAHFIINAVERGQHVGHRVHIAY